MPPASSPNVTWQEGGVPPAAKEAALGHKGAVVWLTGLSGAGKSAVATTLEAALASRGVATALLDGDNVRHGLCADLGFSEADRAENVRRVGEVAKLMADAGLIVIAALVSPYAAHRDAVRARLPEGRFVEVWADAPLSVCEARDPKRLYAAARAGKLAGLTGVDAPYEAPPSPEITLACDGRTPPAVLAGAIVAHLESTGLIPTGARANTTACGAQGAVVPMPSAAAARVAQAQRAVDSSAAKK